MNRLLLATPLLVAALLAQGCAPLSDRAERADHSARDAVTSLRFDPVPLPAGEEGAKGIHATPGITVDYADGSRERFPLRYRVLYRSGDRDAHGNRVGALLDRFGRPLLDQGEPLISNRPDGTTVLRDGDGWPVLVSHFEDRPGAIYATRLVEGKEGWRAERFQNIDFSPVEGAYVNCAAVRTPWNTHLSAEEDYDLDAHLFDPLTRPFAGKQHYDARCPEGKGSHKLCKRVARMKAYLAGRPLNPYRYGYPLEVELNEGGEAALRDGLKHYAMGKGTPELALVMPDRRTVYLGDDGKYGGLYLFVADRPGELDEGTLYMARWEVGEAGRAPLQWLRLGHASDRMLAEFIARAPSFSQLFVSADAEACPEEKGFRRIMAGSNQPLCLKPRPHSASFPTADEQRTAQAFLEKRKLGALLGATTEFNKVEAFTYDPDRNRVYFTASYVQGGMTEGDPAGPDHIRLAANPCGAVLAMDLGAAEDRDGRAIDSDYVATDLSLLLAGRPLGLDEPHAERNYCAVEGIAAPDNLRYIGYDTLLIGEDTSGHFHNMAWAYQLDSGELTRIFAAPTGGEITGMFPDLRGERGDALLINVQHPLKDKAYNAAGEVTNHAWLKGADADERRGVVGYLEGFPAMDFLQP